MTKNAVRLTFICLLVVAGTGVWMRAMPFLPDLGLSFENLRHAHSHLAFLGWVFSAFYLAFSVLFLPEGSLRTPRFQQLFWLIQLVNGGMFFSFLLDGYGAASIVMLTAHTVLALLFFTWFLKKANLPRRQASSWFAWAAIAGFGLSSLGPFAIPLIQVFGGGNHAWTKLAIHFYLHFHYNAWFVFGLLAILLKVFEKEGIALPARHVAWSFGLMAAGVVPAYFLTVLFVEWPSAVLDSVKFGVVAQWLGVAILAFYFIKNLRAVNAGVRFLLPFSLAFLLVKFTVEMLTVLPPVYALVQTGNHFLTIGWLHLLFLGSITPFILWFFAKNAWGYWQDPVVQVGAGCFTTGFVGSEAVLFALGLGFPIAWTPVWLLGFSALMFGGIAMMFRAVISQSKKVVPAADLKDFFINQKIAAFHENAPAKH